MKRGFTLMEVLVAAVVLSIGDREAKKGRALLESVALMEEQVASPASCVEPKKDAGDTSLVTVPVSRQGIDFALSYERIPGGAPLQWVSVHETSGYWSDLTLKRIVRCVEMVSRW